MTLDPNAQTQLYEKPVFFAHKFLEFEPFNYQEKLLNDKSQRIIACMGRQTGKTSTIAARAIHYAYTHKKTTTLIISPSLRQSMIMFDKILTLIYNNPFLSSSVKRKTHTIIQLSTQSKIIALPCSENLLRGYTAHLVIADEAAFIPENVITEIIYPMLKTPSSQPLS